MREMTEDDLGLELMPILRHRRQVHWIMEGEGLGSVAPMLEALIPDRIRWMMMNGAGYIRIGPRL